ncbi:MAG: hypothetical protein QXQ69_00920 [Candidatus Aenigmatarchaeota archaeon]
MLTEEGTSKTKNPVEEPRVKKKRGIKNKEERNIKNLYKLSFFSSLFNLIINIKRMKIKRLARAYFLRCLMSFIATIFISLSFVTSIIFRDAFSCFNFSLGNLVRYTKSSTIIEA